jgi:phage/plasmid-associated DNA primase
METILDNCGLNNSSLWCVSSSLLRFGVIVPKSKLTTELCERRIDQISNLYPVNDRKKALGVAVHEREHGNMRGFTLIGDDEGIANLWANLYIGEVGIKGWDILQRSMCWTACAPGTVFVPYIDIDERGTEEDFERVYHERLLPTITEIQKKIPGASADQKRGVIFYNIREDGDLFKYSFHVHWPSLGVVNIMDWKRFLGSLDELPRKLIWKKEGETWVVTPDDRQSIVDPAVYGGKRQLFRGPFCGKGGNASATMLPLATRVDDSGQVCISKRVFDKAEIMQYILDARIAKWPTGLAILDFQSSGVISHIREADAPTPAPRVVITLPERESPLMEFLMPLLVNLILPKWQAKRKHDLEALNAKGAVVPTHNLRISKNIPHRSKPGIRHIQIEGDTFCEMDPDHVHTRSPGVIGITIDFVSGTIQQSCFACGKNSDKYCFLHQGNRVEITTETEGKFTSTSHWAQLGMPHQFILDYFPEMFLLQRTTRTLWVYDTRHAVWRTGETGNAVVGLLVDDLNSRFQKYLTAYQTIISNARIQRFVNSNREATEDAVDAFIADVWQSARKFMIKSTPLIKVGPASRAKILDDLKSYDIHRETKEMNIFPHLIPMKNRMCINVFTLEVKEMAAEHLFTSCVNAELTSDADDIKEIEQWFREISAGDDQRCVYLKRFGAYCLTFLVHDRKFVVLVGCGKNGKGTYKEFIMSISKGPEGFESRCKNLLQNFWDRRGNANTGAENPTPESHELLNKTVYYTDDIQPIPLDANKIKRIAGGEEGSGRGLWGKPVDIKPLGKMLWTSNFEPNGPGEDNAYYERQVIVPMPAKYVPEGQPTDPVRFRFQQNHVRYASLLEKRDAFFTICVKELSAYYRSLQWNAVTQQPLVLSSFPLPRSCEIANNESRARQLPLAAFMAEYTKPVIHPLEFVTVDELFSNYIIYLENMNEMRTKRDTTQTSFVRLLASALEINCSKTHVEGKALIRKVIPSNQKFRDCVGGERVVGEQYSFSQN